MASKVTDWAGKLCWNSKISTESSLPGRRTESGGDGLCHIPYKTEWILLGQEEVQQRQHHEPLHQQPEDHRDEIQTQRAGHLSHVLNLHHLGRDQEHDTSGRQEDDPGGDPHADRHQVVEEVAYDGGFLSQLGYGDAYGGGGHHQAQDVGALDDLGADFEFVEICNTESRDFSTESRWNSLHCYIGKANKSYFLTRS